MTYQESGRLSVKITMLNDKSVTLPMEFIPECYLRGGSSYPGIALLEGYDQVAELTGEQWVFEGVTYHYAEGKSISHTITDDEDKTIGSWEILLDGKPTTFAAIEEIAFSLYTEEE